MMGKEQLWKYWRNKLSGEHVMTMTGVYSEYPDWEMTTRDQYLKWIDEHSADAPAQADAIATLRAENARLYAQVAALTAALERAESLLKGVEGNAPQTIAQSENKRRQSQYAWSMWIAGQLIRGYFKKEFEPKTPGEARAQGEGGE